MLNGYINRVLWVVPNRDLIKAASADVKKMSPDLDCRELSSTSVCDYSNSGIFFVTYTFLTTMQNQAKIREWIGDDFDGMVSYEKRVYLFYVPSISNIWGLVGFR